MNKYVKNVITIVRHRDSSSIDESPAREAGALDTGSEGIGGGEFGQSMLDRFRFRGEDRAASTLMATTLLFGPWEKSIGHQLLRQSRHR